jgi:hypothetical protein
MAEACVRWSAGHLFARSNFIGVVLLCFGGIGEMKFFHKSIFVFLSVMVML